MLKNNKIEKIVHLFTIMVVVFSLAWATLPMLLLRENYAFIVHDNMDSFAGTAQMIYKNHLYFSLDQPLPIMNGLGGEYTGIAFELYDFLNCMFGYLTGQILTRMIGVALGFFSLKHLLEYIYPERSRFQQDIILLLSAAYIITPIAPNRMIGFASLPLVIEFYLYLREKYKFKPLVFLAIIPSMVTDFGSITVFILGFWFLFGAADTIVRRRLNVNICTAFVLMSISTVCVNINFIKIAFIAEETNRSLRLKDTFSFMWETFVDYLQNGQYHSTALQKKVVLPFLILSTIYVVVLLLKKEYVNAPYKKRCFFILFFGWGLWFFSALIETLQESGLQTGILIIDGFQWGRVIGFMRIMWYLMLASVLFLVDHHRVWNAVLYVAVCAQIVNVAHSPTRYNDVLTSVKVHFRQQAVPTYQEFFSEELFEDIKQDISYSGEGVAAYGYHPAVLLFNNFNTIDGYFSVHSMKWQEEFREIIAPALDLYEIWRTYYDTWGGRMYLFGELTYEPTIDKNTIPTPLYINAEAYKKYGGKYILSRAEISNADDIGLKFVNDYDRDDSMYHIYLYSVE